MNNALTTNLRKLDDFLMSPFVDDEAMILSELSGYLAGVVTCPELIPPSEWLPIIWGEEPPLFEDENHAQQIMKLVMDFYNDTIKQLDSGYYTPIYGIDFDDTTIWESWIEGFVAALALRIDSWLPYLESDDEDIQTATVLMFRLAEMTLAVEPQPGIPELDEELEDMAADLIPYSLQILHRARLGTASEARSFAKKVGRNEPCPCGSGKKYKKCCFVRSVPMYN